MHLRVYADGDGEGKGSHVSLYVYIMRGEFDNSLKWPFRGDVTIKLLNQLEDKNHYKITLPFSDKIPDDITRRMTAGERRVFGLGYSQFIPHSGLNYNPTKKTQYLKDDCLYFQVSKVKL